MRVVASALLPGAGYLTLTNAGTIEQVLVGMLMQPRHPLRPGERVSITLRFSSGQSITVPFAVRGANASGHS